MNPKLDALIANFRPKFGDPEAVRIADLCRRRDQLIRKIDPKGWTYDKRVDKKRADEDLGRCESSLEHAIAQYNLTNNP